MYWKFIKTLSSLDKLLCPTGGSASPSKWLPLQEWKYASHTAYVLWCSTSRQTLHHSPRPLSQSDISKASLSERHPIQLEVAKAGLAPKEDCQFLFFCVHALQDASSRSPLSPLLWLWLPPDVTPLLVTAQTLGTDFVVSVYLSQLFSLAVKFMEFRTLLNHYSVSFSWKEIYKEL